VFGPAGTILEHGYGPNASACTEDCPDRHICYLFVSGKIMGQKKLTDIQCPFRETHSMTSRAWMLCATTGISIEDLIVWVKQQGGDSRRILKIMRRGELNGVRWTVDERNGFLKITSVVTP
jgi:hypothetical protein